MYPLPLRAHFKTASRGAWADQNTPEMREYLPRSAHLYSRPACLQQGFEMHSKVKAKHAISALIMVRASQLNTTILRTISYSSSKMFIALTPFSIQSGSFRENTLAKDRHRCQ